MCEIYIIGDIHGRFEYLNSFINSLQKDSIFIVCGDFGYFPNIDSVSKISTIDIKNHKLYFCPGNHEDWESLDKISTSPTITEIENNIFYCPFGSILSLDRYNILFCGGAESPDWKQRTPGYDWFPQEGISYRDMSNLPCTAEIDVNVIISHACPQFCLSYLNISSWHDCFASLRYLEDVYEIYKPLRWYFGHFHLPASFIHNETHFYSLNKLPNNNSISKLGF